VIMRCLERTPAKRFQSAADVAAALTGASPTAPSDDTPSGRFAGLFRRKPKT
jgi:hypothetical protein